MAFFSNVTRYWWLHRGVKEHAPTIDPVMIPYRFTGGNFAAKVMRGAGQRHSWMMNEFEMMNVLHHPRLIREDRNPLQRDACVP